MTEQPQQVNPDEPPNFNIESDADVEPLVTQLKVFLEKHDMNCSVKLRPKKMRGATSTVDGDGIKTGEVNIPSDFTITGRDNNGKEVKHGGDAVKVKIVDPQGNEVTCEVVDKDDGTYEVKYTPLVPGIHKVEVQVNDEQVENTPIDVYVYDEIPDALNCTADGEGLKTAETKTPAPFKITARNRINEPLKKGGLVFDVKVTGPTTPADVQVIDNNDGTYDVNYTAKEVGDHHIDVLVKLPEDRPKEEAQQDDKKTDDQQSQNENLKRIKEMPVDVKVELNKNSADPTKSYAEGPGVNGGANSRDPAEFTIHPIKSNGEPCDPAENTNFDVCVTDPDDNEIEAKVTKNEDGTYHAEYQPTKPGEYQVEVMLRNPDVPTNFDHIKDSPFTCKILQDPSTACLLNSYAYGPGVDGKIGIDKIPVFRIQAVTLSGVKCTKGGDEFKVEVKNPEGEVQTPKVNDKKNGTYDVKYKAKKPGFYEVKITLKDPEHPEEFKDIKGSVYRPEILNGVEPKNCIVEGQGITEPNDEDDNIFTIQAMDFDNKKVEHGDTPFQVTIDQISIITDEKKDGEKEKEDTDDEKDNEEEVNDEDDGADEMFAMLQDTVNPSNENEDQKTIEGTPEQSKQEESQQEETKEEQPKQDEKAQEESKEPEIEGKKIRQRKQGNLPCTVVDKENGTYDVHYKAEAGKIRVKITLNNDKVAKSPYYLEVEEDADADESGVENFCFVVEAKNRRGQIQKDGKAKFTVDLDGPEGKLEEQKIKIKHLGEGKYFISYTLPAVKGDYNVNCKLNRRHIANSPFKQSVN
ncbi:actin binding protein, putative [Entamoeba invadens IP1]|uniref:Actin binding protein, putative n=1 Tax=Entamoeba invadens IP1 TaxID=370355 RepID=A0A0A1U689_ENTIV|nr:actin binding protein, putative [Entamoeba invadens IP1]ELP89877.1 actin binding protein, putative [Entamoeba invadens IP1]|eukprot:XP_004256648.1 actin binding protein, putative [Entamoeba invadens IP1]